MFAPFMKNKISLKVSFFLNYLLYSYYYIIYKEYNKCKYKIKHNK